MFTITKKLMLLLVIPLLALDGCPGRSCLPKPTKIKSTEENDGGSGRKCLKKKKDKKSSKNVQESKGQGNSSTVALPSIDQSEPTDTDSEDGESTHPDSNSGHPTDLIVNEENNTKIELDDKNKDINKNKSPQSPQKRSWTDKIKNFFGIKSKEDSNPYDQIVDDMCKKPI